MLFKPQEVSLRFSWSNRGPSAQTAAPAGPRADFAQLVRTHAPYVLRVLRSLGVSSSDLPDVSQEVFITVHRQLPLFEGRSALRTWIYGIALRVASDYRSKAYRRRELPSEAPPEQFAHPSQQAQFERREAWQLIERLLAQLDEDRRRVFVLYELEQLSMREVSEIVGCPLSTAYSRLNSARAAVQAALAAQRGGRDE
jgi:RNA polymerase sigma-70 factor (ECF subfamily)